METRVVCFGIWDLLHVGHLRFFQKARAQGSWLGVGVPSDAVVIADKGRPPIIPFDQRLEMLEQLRCVDAARSYSTLDFLPVLEWFNPHVLAVGENWGGAERHKAAEAWVEERGGRVVRLPRTEGVSTTEIRATILHDGWA